MCNEASIVYKYFRFHAPILLTTPTNPKCTFWPHFQNEYLNQTRKENEELNILNNIILFSKFSNRDYEYDQKNAVSFQTISFVYNLFSFMNLTTCQSNYMITFRVAIF